jgi:hypothetical protein
VTAARNTGPMRRRPHARTAADRSSGTKTQTAHHVLCPRVHIAPCTVVIGPPTSRPRPGGSVRPPSRSACRAAAAAIRGSSASPRSSWKRRRPNWPTCRERSRRPRKRTIPRKATAAARLATPRCFATARTAPGAVSPWVPSTPFPVAPAARRVIRTQRRAPPAATRRQGRPPTSRGAVTSGGCSTTCLVKPAGPAGLCCSLRRDARRGRRTGRGARSVRRRLAPLPTHCASRRGSRAGSPGSRATS